MKKTNKEDERIKELKESLDNLDFTKKLIEEMEGKKKRNKTKQK